jgi:hypothetical protein
MRIFLIAAGLLFAVSANAKPNTERDFKPSSVPGVFACSFFQLKGHESVEVKAPQGATCKVEFRKDTGRQIYNKGAL